MPIYEWQCRPCELRFEALASVAEAARSRQCPQCGRQAKRIVSAFAIGASASAGTAKADAAPHASGHHARPPVIPPFARPCWMDDKSAERFAAYKAGRGHEYDDKQAAHQELLKKRGEPHPARAHAHSQVARIVARNKARETKPASTGSGGPNSTPA